MEFNLGDGFELLERTPGVLQQWLADLPKSWVRTNEGPETFSAADVVAHLISGEKKDWVPRLKIILNYGTSRAFDPFDRTPEGSEAALSHLLDEFQRLRQENLATVRAMDLTSEHLDLEGIHPEFGVVNARQLLATWVVHDQTHLAQIARILARQYEEAVGPWKVYLGVLNRVLPDSI